MGVSEIAARVSELEVDTAAFQLISDPNVAWYLGYTLTRFDGGAQDGADRANESAFFSASKWRSNSCGEKDTHSKLAHDPNI